MGIISSFIKGTQLHTENETGTRRKIKIKTSSNKRPVVLYRLVAQNRYDDIFTHTRTTDTPIVSFQEGALCATSKGLKKKKRLPAELDPVLCGMKREPSFNLFFFLCLSL